MSGGATQRSVCRVGLAAPVPACSVGCCSPAFPHNLHRAGGKGGEATQILHVIIREPKQPLVCNCKNTRVEGTQQSLDSPAQLCGFHQSSLLKKSSEIVSMKNLQENKSELFFFFFPPHQAKRFISKKILSLT